MSKVLPITEWPAADRAMWTSLTNIAGPLDGDGALGHLRPTTLHALGQRYGRWMQWVLTSDPWTEPESPDMRLTAERMLRWLDDLSHTRPLTKLAFVDGTLRVLRAWAPEKDWSVQLRILAKLRILAGPGDHVRKAGRIVSSSVLFNAGVRHATADASSATTPMEAMKRIRNGTMIATLALMPIRLRAFTGLTLGKSVVCNDDRAIVFLDSDLTKNGRPWQADVPEVLIPHLLRYSEVARPWFMRLGQQEHEFLWVGDHGGPFQQGHLSAKISSITAKLTGIRISPHLFRDAAATTLVDTSSNCIGLVPAVLGHSDFRTAERHYVQATTIEASREYSRLVANLKRGGR